MEELKLLIEMVAGLPAMAMWVLVGFFAYKVVVIGSIYGLIRYVTGQLFDWLKSKPGNATTQIDDICITGAKSELIAQIHRLRAHSSYVHISDVGWLRQAIDDKIEKDRAAGKTDRH